MKKSLEEEEEEEEKEKKSFCIQLKRRRNEKKKRKMKINTELTCWRKCSRKYPSNEKKKKKKIRKGKKRKEKKKNCPTSFLAFCKDFFYKKCASNLLLRASILGVRLDNKVNYFPQGQIFRIYMYIYSKPYQIMIHDVLRFFFFFFFFFFMSAWLDKQFHATSHTWGC